MILVSLLLSSAHAQDVRTTWQPPCEVPVLEEVDKGEGTSTLRYRVRVEEGPDGGLLVTLGGFELVAIEGFDLGPEEMAQASEMLGKVGTLPPAVIDASGAFSRVATDRKTLKAVLDSLGLSATEQREMLKMFRSDELLGLMASDLARLWWAWAGAWTGPALEEGGSRSGDADYFGGDGARGLVPTLWSRSPCAEGQLCLRAEMAVPVDRLRMEWLLLLGAGMGTTELGPGRAVIAQAELDARTRRPLHTRLEVADRLTGGAAHLQHRDTRWLWDEAQGCGITP